MRNICIIQCHSSIPTFPVAVNIKVVTVAMQWLNLASAHAPYKLFPVPVKNVALRWLDLLFGPGFILISRVSRGRGEPCICAKDRLRVAASDQMNLEVEGVFMEWGKKEH